MFLCKIFFLLLEKYSNNHRHNYLVLNGCSQACRYHSSCLSCYHLRLLADSEFYIAPQVWHRGMKMSESYVIGLFEKRKGTLIFPRTKLWLFLADDSTVFILTWTSVVLRSFFLNVPETSIVLLTFRLDGHLWRNMTSWQLECTMLQNAFRVIWTWCWKNVRSVTYKLQYVSLSWYHIMMIRVMYRNFQRLRRNSGSEPS